MQCNLNTLLLSHEGNQLGGNFRSFNLHGKRKNAKNKTNTDPNPESLPNRYSAL